MPTSEQSYCLFCYITVDLKYNNKRSTFGWLTISRKDSTTVSLTANNQEPFLSHSCECNVISQSEQYCGGRILFTALESEFLTWQQSWSLI